MESRATNCGFNPLAGIHSLLRDYIARRGWSPDDEGFQSPGGDSLSSEDGKSQMEWGRWVGRFNPLAGIHSLLSRWWGGWPPR